jgi:16S rRNA (adenine1518-N6/adenine1519-N6)-dimethyltransferase
MNQAPRKRFGQHFLKDTHVIRRIVAMVSPQPGERLVEIGPGRGAITRPLLQLAGSMDVIELDRDLVPLLRKKCDGAGLLRVHNADALSFDFGALPAAGEELRIVGNLPYNISTPLLFHLLSYRQHIRDLHLMLQEEVIARLAAQPGSKAYGRLSIMVQHGCVVTPLFSVAPEAFRPRPRVVSGVVRLAPRPKPLADVGDATRFSSLVIQAFSKRRKTLRNALKGVLDEQLIRRCGLDPMARPETLEIEQFAALSRALSDSGATNQSLGTQLP